MDLPAKSLELTSETWKKVIVKMIELFHYNLYETFEI